MSMQNMEATEDETSVMVRMVRMFILMFHVVL